MNTKHTPGPWKVGHLGLRVVGDVRHGGMHGALQSTVAECEREADARLIAAAPELLAALQRIVREFDCGRTPLATDLSIARAALAKAGAL
jgi:hypothetical protein